MQFARQVRAAIAENHRLARPGHAVDHPVAVAQPAGQFFLFQIQHP